MKAGVLFPLSSFPSDFGIGDFGKNAYQTIDLLKQNGADYLQILPFHPSYQANSPYRAISTYAGDEIYIDLNQLVDMNLLNDVEPYLSDSSVVYYDKVREFKHKYLLKAYKNFKENDEYQEFLKMSPWVLNYAIFCTFATINGTFDWASWKDEYKYYPKYYQVNLEQYQDEIGYYQFVQYIFYKQWFALKKYANEKGIKIIGDMPFYVDHGSVEVWIDNCSFLLDEDGYPTDVAGVPPDYFSETGQYWGNPIYDWDYLKEHDFDFWVNRIGWASKIFDITRIDHFRAFDSYWDIPSNFTTAANGYWRYAPGYELFDCLYDKLGDIELVAEDLGYLRKEVVELKDHYGLKGMKVFQFMSIDELEELSECFFYPGTHDNETLKGWIEGLDDYQVESYRSYFKSDLPLNQAIISYCLHSDASDVIIPIWDLLEVNNDQRFNVPGEVNDINWTYRVPEIDLVKKGLALFFKLRKEGQDEF